MTVQSVSVNFKTTYQGRGLDQFNRDLSTMSGQVKKMSVGAAQSFTAFGRFAQAAGTALLVGVGAALAVGIKASIDFESAFAGVRKTVSASEGEFQMLASQIRDMATTIPVAATELARIGELGGQLGVPIGDLEEFISVIAQLGVTTNLSTDEAATSIARFMEVMGTPGEEIEPLASSLVELGNNFATTESEILNFGSRLTGVGSILGMSEGDVLGLATAFTALGEPAERGATALQRTFLEMLEAIQTGSSELLIFADTAGMTADEFAQIFEEDPAEALLMFLDGLRHIAADGGNVIGVLDSLGLSSQRTVGLLLKGASGYETVAEALAMGNEAYADNIALSEEAEKRFATLQSQITLIGNKFTDLRIEIGDKAAPAVADFLGWLGGLFDIIKENLGVLEGFAVLIATIGAGRGLVKIGTMFSNILLGFGKTTGAGIKLADMMGGLAGGVRFLGLATGGAALALGAVATVMAVNRAKANAYKDAIEGLTDAMQGLKDGTVELRDVRAAFMEVLAMPTGIFDFTLDLNEFRQMLIDLGQSAPGLVDLAITDFEEFGQRTSSTIEMLGKAVGLTDEEIKKAQDTLSLEFIPARGVGSPADIKTLQDYLFVIREITGATTHLREEEQLRADERRIAAEEALLDASMGAPDMLALREAMEAFAAGNEGLTPLTEGLMVGADEWGEVLEELADSTMTFSDEFIGAWQDTVDDFNSLLFDWSTAWDEYENVEALSTKKLTTSITNWVEDQQRLTDTLSHVYDTFGTEIGMFFQSLPEDLQRGLAATLAKSGPDAFADQLTVLTDAWGDLMGFALENALTMAPAGAEQGLESWVTFFDSELTPLMEGKAVEGSQAWLDATIGSFATWKNELAAESPEVAAAFDEMIASAIMAMDTDNELIDIAAVTANMSTQEKIQFFVSLGVSWRDAIALGFGTLPGILGNIANQAGRRVNEDFSDEVGIRSPSKVFAEFGKMSALGFQLGFETQAKTIPYLSNRPVINMQAQAAGQVKGHEITINYPQHKDDDILHSLQKATTLVGLVREAEIVAGNR